MALNLDDSRSKLLWADRQREALRAEIAAWVDRENVRPVHEADAELAAAGWVLDIATAPPDAVRHLIGQSVDPLRSALDYTAWQLYLAGGGDPAAGRARSVTFPVVHQPERWDAVCAAALPYADPAVVDVVRDVQPFASPDGDGHLLATLAGLSNPGKHRQPGIAAIVELQAQVELSVPAPDGFEIAVHVRPEVRFEPGRQWVTRVVCHPQGQPEVIAARSVMPDLDQPTAPGLAVGVVVEPWVVLWSDLERIRDLVSRIVEGVAAAHR